MWVRSQDKNLLLKCSEFTFHHLKILNKDYYHIETEHFPNGTCTTLGRYSTKEKALKVLDMIEKHLNSQTKIIEKSRNDYYISDLELNVFQMPLDEDLEDET